MKSLWNEKDVKGWEHDPLQLRVYTSRLLGQSPELVLHGGGNTSVKLEMNNFFGDAEKVLYVKGSGWDLRTIEAEGFAPVRLETLQRMASLAQLSDSDMVTQQRAAMLDPKAPNPSVEAILHAILPFRYVDHTHADAVVTITNNRQAAEYIQNIYGNRVLVIPYVMPGFVLAKRVYEMTQGVDWNQIEGMILMHHGVFTFGEEAQTSYERMIDLVTQAEQFLEGSKAKISVTHSQHKEDLVKLARIRSKIAEILKKPLIVQWDQGAEAQHFASLNHVSDIATRGPLTPDHVLRTKPIPVVLGEAIEQEIEDFAQNYQNYFNRHKTQNLTCLDVAPRWGVWKEQGVLAFGQTLKEAQIVSDICQHTRQAIQLGEALGGWEPLGEKDLFDVEYWELEQNKLKTHRIAPSLQGKIALVTGGAQGIGKACAEELHAQGAVVVALDVNPQITKIWNQRGLVGAVGDVTDETAMKAIVEEVVRSFGGLDIVVANAGIFPRSCSIATMESTLWQQSLDVNLSSQQKLLTLCIPYLKYGFEPAVIFIASKNVAAPGPGAAAYSVAKAGQVQLARVAALELAGEGIRVNMVHPNAVFDTGIWSDGVLHERAKRYGLSVAEYKKNNLLNTEITAVDVAKLVGNLVGKHFSKTTGAQIPIDGGNERVI